MKKPQSLPPDYFERMYAADPDPWGFETRPYEREKYAATLAALPQRRYGRALEIGCSIGVLTKRLEAHCDHLLAVDVNERALAKARERCADLPHVHFERRFLPEEFPDGTFDLILVSEVGYYWAGDDFERAHELIWERLAPGGTLLLVHWTPHVDDYPLTGDEVHEAFLAQVGRRWQHRMGQRHDTYRLDVLKRV
ncbi:MAG: SAM-dependent methyltransferase [Catalinimonas sp.]